MPRKEADGILEDWVDNEKLRIHMRQVAAVMRAWAEEKEGLAGPDAEKWEIAGLLHDADWDRWPDEHCKRIIEHLEGLEQDPEVLHAIASHSPAFFGVEPHTRMDHMLYAFDELSGFVHAVSLVRPGMYEGMKPKSVKKKLKEKSFAAQVNRDDIYDAAERAGVDLDDLIDFVITHQREVS
jgi:predicted hydrolase (HD superfamily)